MKLKLRHNENTTVLTFGDGGYIYANESELNPNLSWRTRIIDDGNHQAIVRFDQFVLLDMPDTRQDGVENLPVHSYRADWNHVFRVIIKLREKYKADLKGWVDAGNKEWRFKEVEQELDLDRFRFPIYEVPKLNWQQIANHPNMVEKERLSETVRHFKECVEPEKFTRLKEELCHYLSRAKVFPQREEFYFDGRRLENGCGFNGGFIIHGKDWSIHT